MRISFLSIRQGRFLLVGGLLAWLVSVVVASHYEDGFTLVLFPFALLVMLTYWHFKGYYVSLTHDQVVLQNEVRRLSQPRDQLWKVASISGPVYELVFHDRTRYLFVYRPAFPFYRGFGSNEAQAAAILHQIKENKT